MNAATAQPLDWSSIVPDQAVFRRPSTSIWYRFWLLPVAGAMLLLPVIYVALLALTAYGVYYHGAHNLTPIMAWGGGVIIWQAQLMKVVIYVAPLVAGIIMVFFMIKPLFAPRARKARPYPLDPEVEPELFSFIATICQVVGAPQPRQIELNCELNAAAGFRRGFLSFFGHDLVLVIGLPLLGLVSVEEFAGILAHEFGHFGQGVGMRLTYIIRRVNDWFARVVFQRDAWDEMLAEWHRDSEGVTMSFIVNCARLGVFLSRFILYLLCLLGNFISSRMARQGEFNADAYAINVIGSAAFENNIRRTAVLQCAAGLSYRHINAMWNKEHCLPDNFSKFLAIFAQSLPEAVLRQIDDTLGLAKTGMFDTHPCDAERIRQARRMGQPGLLHCDAPATGLFRDFHAVATEVTLLHYRNLRIPVTRESLRPVGETPLERREHQAQFAATLDRYFCAMLPILLPIAIPPQQLAPPKNLDEVRESARNFRARLASVAGQIAGVMADYKLAETRASQAGAARAFLDAGCPFDPAAFGLADTSAQAVQQAATEAEECRRKCQHSLATVSEELLRHFASTLSFLYVPSVEQLLADSENLKKETRTLAYFLSQLAPAYPLLVACRQESCFLAAFLAAQPGGARTAGAMASAHRLSDGLSRLRDATIVVNNPFLAGKRAGCFFDQLAGPRPNSNDPAAILSFSAAAVARFSEIYTHAVGRLAQIAETVEMAL